MLDKAPIRPHDQTLRELLKNTRTIAVVGLSPKPVRDSHDVSAYIQRAGYRIIPVNPGQKEILGEKCYKDLGDIPHPVDMVNVFRRSEFIPPIAEAAIAIKAKSLWLQLGISHYEASTRAQAAGLVVVEDLCLKIEHKRLL